MVNWRVLIENKRQRQRQIQTQSIKQKRQKDSQKEPLVPLVPSPRKKMNVRIKTCTRKNHAHNISRGQIKGAEIYLISKLNPDHGEGEECVIFNASHCRWGRVKAHDLTRKGRRGVCGGG